MAKKKEIDVEIKDFIEAFQDENTGCGVYPIRVTKCKNFTESLLVTPMLNNGVIITTRIEMNTGEAFSTSSTLLDVKIYQRIKKLSDGKTESFGYYLAKFPDSTRDGIESVGIS